MTMKLRVDIYALNRDAEDVKVGEIRFDGETITTSSTDKLLMRMASVPIRANGKQIDPDAEPERFVRNLWQEYSSPYLRALKARIAVVAVLAVAAMALIGTTATAGIDEADLALSAARLDAATETAAPHAWRYVANPDMEADAVELAPDEQAQPADFFQFKPLERPAGVPEDFVPVRVFQFRQEGWKFWGWLLLPMKTVRELHENRVST
jgi:hypothetical protein